MGARLTGVVVCLAFALGACASGIWQQGQQGEEHPLAGQIYRVADGARVSEAALIADAAGADFVLLGEVAVDRRLQLDDRAEDPALE